MAATIKNPTPDTSKHADPDPDPQQQVEFAKFEKAIGVPNMDPVMLVLRAHLFTEALLERLILVSLPRGDKIVEAGNLTYAQKLVLVEALQKLPDDITSSLRGLNKVRNQCAHELGKEISETDVTRIGSPFGAAFSRMRVSAGGNMGDLLYRAISRICGFMAARCHDSETRTDPNTSSKAPKRAAT
ncbi:hypothetical protein [Ralstonia chuxiongensis]|uniref:Uncharacterized protein n=1 Tax=Ralstonia chuxiongensis TaxID=2957504 RepID=A0AA42BIQ2_9RALS|nr:hypothetical protein [Ralstonia chuxiongensis]MCP1174314.1 hypothetical protein [Ralstonia chuxiongensis]